MLAMTAGVATALTAAAGMPENRTIDGSGNNLAHPDWGKEQTRLQRKSPAAYGNGFSTLGGVDRPNPRVISNNIHPQATMLQGEFIPDPRGLTDFTWGFGQFLAHDVAFTHDDGTEFAFIQVPAGDFWFDPKGQGGAVIPFRRSLHDPATGTDPSNPREQLIDITGWVDGSNVYASREDRAHWLRTFEGGRLKTSPHETGDMMPYNDGTQSNTFAGNDPAHFVAGDQRANIVLSLLAVHTLFVREHNRWADEIAAANPTWTDEEIYQRARRIVGAELQAITYNEFIPTMLGKNALPAYAGYNPEVDPRIVTEFSTAGFRVGHTMLSPVVLRLDADGNTIPEGNIDLFTNFFTPERLTNEGGIEPILRGLAAGQQQRVDARVIDDLRSFLINAPGAGEPAALDLVSLNIQRGRDHGLSDYNTVRQAYGLPPRTSLSEISSDPEIAAAFEATYSDINDVDLWPGIISEDLYPGASVGETLRAIWIDQFARLRDGDRFWHQNDPELTDLLPWLESVRLKDIIVLNTSIQPHELPDNVFRIPCVPDLNGDGLVNGADLAQLLAQWGSQESNSSGDLDDDGFVNGADLAMLLSSWGDCYN